jgi:hypothetical protein
LDEKGVRHTRGEHQPDAATGERQPDAVASGGEDQPDALASTEA